jgi:hypothetical protein
MSGDHSTKPPSESSLLPLVLTMLNQRIEALAEDIREIKKAQSPTGTSTAIGIPSWLNIANLIMGAWRIFGPILPHAIAVAGAFGAGVVAAWKWVRPWLMHLLNY